MQEICLFASDMRVRMLVRASMYASSCMCAVARMCAWFSACFSVLVLTSRQRLYLHPFSSMCFCTCALSRIVSASLHEARQHHPWVMSK